MPNIASKQTIYLRTEERYKTSNSAVAREGIYLLFYEFSEFFDEKQLFNAGSKITKIADRNGRHNGCPNGARGWSDLPTTAGTIFQPRIFLFLKGYCSGQSHFLEIDAKLAEENEFVTHFVQKCLETRKNEQNVVFRKRSETARKSF